MSNPKEAITEATIKPTIVIFPTIAIADRNIVLNINVGKARRMDLMYSNRGSTGPKNARRTNDGIECPWKSLTAVKNCNNAVSIYNTMLERLKRL